MCISLFQHLGTLITSMHYPKHHRQIFPKNHKVHTISTQLFFQGHNMLLTLQIIIQHVMYPKFSYTKRNQHNIHNRGTCNIYNLCSFQSFQDMSLTKYLNSIKINSPLHESVFLHFGSCKHLRSHTPPRRNNQSPQPHLHSYVHFFLPPTPPRK